MKFLQGCMGCMGCMSGVGCYNNPSALAGTVRMSDSADGCGACMGCMRGTGCMNSFGLHGVDMGRMVRSFDTLGASNIAMPSGNSPIKTSTRSESSRTATKPQDVLKQLVFQAMIKKDLIGVVKDAIKKPELLKPYVDQFDSFKGQKSGFAQAMTPSIPRTKDARQPSGDELIKNYWGVARFPGAKSLSSLARNLNEKTHPSLVLEIIFDVLQATFCTDSTKLKPFSTLAQASTSKLGASVPSLPTQAIAPFDVYFENYIMLLQKLPLSYKINMDEFKTKYEDAGKQGKQGNQGNQGNQIAVNTVQTSSNSITTTPNTLIKRDPTQGMGPEEGARIASTNQVAMTDQDQATDSSATSDQAPVTEEKKEGLSGTQIALIAVGGIGILGAAWYFMGKKKD